MSEQDAAERQATKRKLDDLIAGGVPDKALTSARPGFDSIPSVVRAQSEAYKKLEQDNAALRQQTYLRGEELQNYINQIENDSRSLESLFNNPTGDNYLQALYLLTKLLPPTKRNAINEYVRITQGQKDPWYAKFEDNNTSYKKAYFGTRNDEIVQFIMWVAKQHVKDVFLQYDPVANLHKTGLSLTHEDYEKYCKVIYPFVFDGQVLGQDIRRNTLLFALISDISIDLLYNISLTCSVYPQGSTLRNCIKYMDENQKLPQIVAGASLEQQNAALFILQVFKKDYSRELEGDVEAQQEYLKRVQAAYEMRPTTNLSVRLRLT